MNTMIYRDGEKRHHNICLSCPPPSYMDGKDICSETIPIFYSVDHAKDEGWKYTNDIRFCPPDRKAVWVCPQCSGRETINT